MIRTNHPHNAFDDLHEYFAKHENELRAWYGEAAYAFANVHISMAATRAIEAKLGRKVGTEAGAAIGWVVTYSMDMISHADRLRRSGASRAALDMAWNDAIETIKGAATSHYLRLHPHAVAQIPIVAKHIRDDHLFP